MIAQVQAQQSQSAEFAEVKAALFKVQGEKELERLKAEKADETVKRMEEVVRECQEEKNKRELRNNALEHKIRIMTRQIPCDRNECDMSCGKEHHCGTPTYRSRRRSRSRNNRQQDAQIPTVANLATAANVPVENMQQLVNQQAQHQAQAQAPSQSRMPPRPNNRATSVGGGTELCRNFHYYKICPRGVNCKFAHELIPANAMGHLRPHLQAGGGRVFTQAINRIQNQAASPAPAQAPAPVVPMPAAPVPKPRSRSGSAPRTGSRQFVPPAYRYDHPDYEWAVNRYGLIPQDQGAAQQAGPAMAIASASQTSGNATGQGLGASPVPLTGPQVVRPRLSPRSNSNSSGTVTQASVSSASSGSLEARRTVSESMAQQSSNQARMNALRDPAWRNTMDNVLNLVNRAYPARSAESRTPSRGSSAETSGAGQD